MLNTVTMHFNETNLMFVRNNEYNRHFVRHTAAMILATLESRGYVYLNQVYEAYGVKWNPEWENVCIIDTDDTTPSIDIKIRKRKCGDYVITVTW